MNIQNYYISQNNKLVRNTFIFLLFALFVFGAWSFFANISSAAVSSGSISVESRKKSIEHLSGGIVSNIYVKEGQYVTKGMPLIKVSDVTTQSKLKQTWLTLLSYKVQYARLLAERAGDAQFKVDLDLSEYKDFILEIDTLISNQKQLFNSRISRRRNELQILDSRISQAQAQIQTSEQMLKQNVLALSYLNDEIKMHDKLLEDGYTSKLQVLELKRNEALLQSDIMSMRTSVSTAKSNLNELHQQKNVTVNENKSEIESEISDIRNKILSLNAELGTLRDTQNRTVLRSPVDGIVLGLSVNSTGEIIKAGEPIMEIVPSLDELLVETLINPKDIDSVHKGLNAMVRLSSFDSRTTPMIRGEVVYVAADKTMSQQGQNSVNGYKVKIKLSSDELKENPEIKLYPGMPAEVFVVLRDKRPIDYLLEPLLGSFFKAFREG
jgi:HlyD family secretion protein